MKSKHYCPVKIRKCTTSHTLIISSFFMTFQFYHKKIDLDSCSCAPRENEILCKQVDYIKSFCLCSRHKIINKCRCDQDFSLSDIQSERRKKTYSCFSQHEPHAVWIRLLKNETNIDHCCKRLP